MDAVRKPRRAGAEPNRKLARVARPRSRPVQALQLAGKIVGGVALSFLIIGAVGTALVASVFWYYGRNLPTIDKVGDYHPKQVTVILDAKGERVGEIFSERRTYVKYEDVPSIVVDSFIYAEDANFRSHAGIDYKGMVRAFITNLSSGRTRQGASTITQQVVKTFLLTPERTFKRKIQEIILARRLEHKLSKNDILTLYMNQVYFGHGRYGVQEAARFYFGKDVKDVNVGEAAMLAGLVQSPESISPLKHPARAKERQAYVLTQLAKHGRISQAEAQKWIDLPIQVVRDPFPHLNESPEWNEVVRAELERRFGKDKIDTLGATVRTTMDPNIQAAAQKALQSALRAVDARHKLGRPIRQVKPDKIELELAKLAKHRKGDPKPGELYEAVVTDVKDSGELALDLGNWRATLWLGGADDERWNPPDAAGKRKAPAERFARGDVVKVKLVEAPKKKDASADDDEAADKPAHPIAAGEHRVAFAPGPEGAMVVIDPHTRDVLAIVGGYHIRPGDFDRALSAHRQPGSSFKPIIYAAALSTKQFTPATLVNDAPEVYDLWKPQNFEKGAFKGPVRLRYALANSINTVAIRVLHDIGPQTAVDLAKQLGESGDLPAMLSLALGSGEVTPLEHTNALASFDAGGVWAPPRFIARIDGQDLPAEPGKQVVAPEVAYVITDMMRSVVEQGTAAKARSLKLTIAGKTGTSNDVRDTWFIGMTPDLVIGTWIGYDAPMPLGAGEVGGVTALPAYIDLMKSIAPKNKPFPRPPGVTTATIDTKTGLLAAPGAPAGSTLDEVFVQGTAPTDVAPLPGEVDASTFVIDEYGDEAPAPAGGDDATGPATVPD